MNSKVIIPLLFLTAACGSNSDSNNNADQKSNILGSWSSTCKIIGHSGSDTSDESTTLDVDDIYGIITMTFAVDDQLITESTEYSDDTCSIATGETEVYSATYVLGDKLITDSGLEAQEIDITYQPPEGISTAYGIIRSEGDILYLSEFDESSRQNSLDLTAPYSKN
jgi:hypothetical protein